MPLEAQREVKMRIRSEENYRSKKEIVMETCFDCFAEHGLHGTGIAALSEACKLSKAAFYVYFKDIDDLILQSTAYCMAKVVKEFVEDAPSNPLEVRGFFEKLPYRTRDEHGKKLRLMYQVYTHPKYIGEGKKFLQSLEEHYEKYAVRMESMMSIPRDKLILLFKIYMRICVNFAIFENEEDLKSEMSLLEDALELLREKYKIDNRIG